MPDPFDAFGLPRRFDLDEAELHAHYVKAAAAAHPDRHTDPVEQAEAAERAALLNDAYRTLLDPEKRANALLVALGGAAKEEDNTLPPDLLMEVMDVRERLEEAVAMRDADALAELRAWANAKRAEHLERTSMLLAGDSPDLKTVRVELNALRYVERMLEQMPEER